MTGDLPPSIANNETLMAELRNQTGQCILPGAVAIQIQNGTEWQQSGCNLGFYCKFPKSVPLDTVLITPTQVKTTP